MLIGEIVAVEGEVEHGEVVAEEPAGADLRIQGEWDGEDMVGQGVSARTQGTVEEAGRGEEHEAGLREAGSLPDAAVEGVRLVSVEDEAVHAGVNGCAAGGRDGGQRLDGTLADGEHVGLVGASEVEAGIAIEVLEGTLGVGKALLGQGRIFEFVGVSGSEPADQTISTTCINQGVNVAQDECVSRAGAADEVDLPDPRTTDPCCEESLQKDVAFGLGVDVVHPDTRGGALRLIGPPWAGEERNVEAPAELRDDLDSPIEATL
ncbi:hypothetical protein [Chondromyces crocatus]|uniref:hypothetical protein n=1 Tax=Chondromyces crocatus TaxID=52 RepID=UPI001FDF96F8|nr:hypothetical protein [Chondromyces crocatus]